MSETTSGTGLRRVLRLRDLVLFYVVAVVGMRWVAVAAAAGPSALVVWLIAAVALQLTASGDLPTWMAGETPVRRQTSKVRSTASTKRGCLRGEPPAIVRR